MLLKLFYKRVEMKLKINRFYNLKTVYFILQHMPVKDFNSMLLQFPNKIFTRYFMICIWFYCSHTNF